MGFFINLIINPFYLNTTFILQNICIFKYNQSLFRVEPKYLISYFKFDNVLKSEVRTEEGLRLKSCNNQLKKIGKTLELPIPLTTYVARYTWANVAKSLGYAKDLIAEGLGHEYGNRITGIYLDNYGSDVIDEMNQKVTGDS
jgi:hypothetical protein